MKKTIKHIGIIDSIKGPHIKVRIMQTAACASCQIAGHCNASETKEKIVDVFSSEMGWDVGQQVVVSTSLQTAHHALLVGFGGPLILLLVVLLAVRWFTGNEETAALVSILSLLPYYLAVWILRKHIESRVSFQIERAKH